MCVNVYMCINVCVSMCVMCVCVCACADACADACAGVIHTEDDEDVYKLPHTKFQSSENGNHVQPERSHTQPERSHTHPDRSYPQSVFKYEEPNYDPR